MNDKKLEFYLRKSPALTRAILYLGGQSRFARLLGLKHQNVWKWLNTYHVAPPAEYAIKIEKLTNGVVTRDQLRPDIFNEE